MHAKLQSLFDKLEKDSKELLQRVETVSDEKFNCKPAGAWSLNQVLAHLITAERLSLGYLSKKIQAVKETGNTGPWEEIKMMALKISQRFPFKFKAPKNLVENTPTYASIDLLIADWNKSRAELKSFLEGIKEQDLNKKIYKHFIAGRLNVKHALRFLREHMIHHQPQINRLLK